MTHPAKDSDRHTVNRLSTDDPAKGGVKPANPTVQPSQDSPNKGSLKPHGDRLQHAVDEAAAKRSRRF
jgi:hypothetical protein